MKSFVVLAFIAIPWLNPVSTGPSPAVVPWLVTLASLSLVLLLAQQVRLSEVAVQAWLVAALASALLGLLQYFGAAAALGSWVSHTDPGEAFANLRQRNQFATLTNIGLAALLCWVAQGQSGPASSANAQQETPLSWKIVATVDAMLLAAGNAASSSRTGLLQLVLLLTIAWIWDRRDRKPRPSYVPWVLLAAALTYGFAVFVLPVLAGLDPNSSGILGRLHDSSSRCLSRMTLWSNVLQLIAQKPWFGWGWGELDYAHFITLYPGERFCDILDNAHNLPLHLAVELGVPLSLAVCSLAVWLVWRAKPWCETNATRQLAWSVLTLIMLHSMLEYPLWYGPFQMAFGMSVILLRRSPDQGSESAAVRAGVPSVMACLGTVCLLLAVAYGGWDYWRVSQIYRAPTMRAEAYRENTLEKIRGSWLFQDQVRFAELTMSPVTGENAVNIHAMAVDLLHFSPEARVIEKVIESATLLGLTEEKQFYLLRYQAAFPESYDLWVREDAGKHAQTEKVRPD